jgi:hypothetical protein
VTVKALNSGDIGQIMELRAFGDRLEPVQMPNVTGTYKTTDGEMIHLKQEGATVTGCYEHALAPLVGGMDGRLLKFEWNAENDDRGPAIMIFGGDHVFGGHWKTTGVSAEHPMLDAFEATKTSAEPGTCPQWKPPQEAMGTEQKITIEGHTVNTSTPEHNQQLAK